MSFIFIVTTCVINEIHKNQLTRCVSSIRNFHSNKIYLINDSKSDHDDFLNNFVETNENIKLIPSYNKGCGEQQIFKFILDCDEINENDNVIYLHDSVIVKKEFDNIMDIKTLKFMWHFTNHRIHWDNIIEERTKYNIDNNIITHTDLIKHNLIKHYTSIPHFLNFALHMADNKHKWVGCMGFMCVINKECLIKMNSVINFANIYLKFNTRRERIVNESTFSIICHYLLSNTNFEDSYDGLYYDGFVDNPGARKELDADDLKLLGENEYIKKISFAR